ncbi:MAG: glycosyltransferase, partial [Rhodospirillales bacterium]|nr:glycosyltransferase [Rhodospirillales bacterium]
MIWIVLFALLAWIYLLILHGGFWLARPRLDAPPQHEPVAWPRIVAVVPARNEADVVAEALESLAKQDYPGAFTVLLIDDRSDDATAAEAQAVAARVPGRLEVLSAGERPPGWTGKLWALNCGTQAAAAAPNFWWFTDADIHHAPDTLRRLVEEAERGQGSQVSLMVRLSCRSA